MDVIKRLDVAWEATWSTTSRLAFLIRYQHADLWVRFHSLPGSKRYAETDAEYGTVVMRHHAVLDELGPGAECFVISDSGEIPAEARPWKIIENDDYFEQPVQLYASSIPYPSRAFDRVLRAAADWEIAYTIIGPYDLRWLYLPYDGGADVIAPSSLQRGQLEAKFRNWLSDHPAGL